MHSLHYKILLGGLTIMLAVTACSTVSTVTSAGPDTPVVQAVPVATETGASQRLAPTASAIPTGASQRLAPTANINTLYMMDANNGWALTENAVLRTTDGGSTWQTASPAGLSGNPSSAFFLDANIGWLAVMGADPTSGTLYHTSDGGANWSSAAVPFGGGSLHFTDAMHGWELVGLNAGMSHEAVAVYRTSDGGTTWTRAIIDDPNVAGFSNSLPLVGDKNGITALDASHAWVTGAQPSDDFIYVYASQDGGTSWTHQDFSIPTGYNQAMTSAALPVFFGASEAVLPVLLFSNSNAAEFYVSQDGGQTWKATTPVPQGGFLAAGSAVDFFVWDGGAPLYVSHDGGASWSTLTPNVNLKDNLVSIQFVNANTGWALTSDASSQHRLYKTMNGGATWNALIP